jgi:hypothetical protein
MTGNYTDRLRGLHQDVWENVDSKKFLKKERQSWEKYAEN